MEDGLGVWKHLMLCASSQGVLILVLVEDGLGDNLQKTIPQEHAGLNPCFSGGWSRRVLRMGRTLIKTPVLILVLVEDGLGA